MLFYEKKRKKETAEILNIDYINLTSRTEKTSDDLYLFSESALLYGPVLKLFKKSIICENNIRFDTRMTYGEDRVFVFKYLSFCKNISYVPKVLYTYYDNAGSLVNSFKGNHLENGMILRKCELDFYLSIGCVTEKLRARCAGFVICGLAVECRKVLSDNSKGYFQKKKIISSMLNIPEVNDSLKYIGQFYMSPYHIGLLTPTPSSRLIISDYLRKKRKLFGRKLNSF